MGLIYENLKAVLMGEMEPEELGPYWQNAVAMPIYLEAVRILAMPFAHRKPMIEEKPARIRDLLRAEVVRIHGIRSGKVIAAPVEKKAPGWHGWQKTD